MIATTGDLFTFDLMVEDNIEISSVFVEYWFGTGVHENDTMSGSGPYALSIIVPLNSLDTLHYIYHAMDTSDNWNFTIQNDVSVQDNDLPGDWFDGSLNLATTGDPYAFNITLTDNIEVGSVSVEYWFGSGTHEYHTMNMSKGSYIHMIGIPRNSLDTLHYIYHARDSSDNWNNSVQHDVPVRDNDLPVFGPDTTPKEGNTGDPFSFMVEVSDNIKMRAVHLEYWFGDEEHEIINMSGPGFYYHTLTLPANSNETLYYLFNATDISYNWNQSVPVEVIIRDNDKPDFYDETTNNTATTGDEFEIRVRVTDNLGIEEVWLEYWFEGGDHLNVSMSGDENFTYTIIIPSDSLDELIYMIRFCDKSGNWNRTHIRNITVVDNDAPIFRPLDLPEYAGTGDGFSCIANISDNIGVEKGVVEYWFGEDVEREEVPMLGNNSLWAASIWIQWDSTEPLHYIIKAMDVSGLWNETEIISIEVRDIIEPQVDAGEDVTCYVGQEFRISIAAQDNIGISSYIWEGAPIEVTGNLLEMIPEEAGTYYVTVRVTDLEGNSAEVEFVITVLPADHDSDEDGIPDLIENENGLDMDDSSDALSDKDEDGLTNLEEFTLGTNISSGDTDEDGMPDKWENYHGLDPITPSSNNDEDGDGSSDLKEYLEGTDPLISDATDDEFDMLIPILILIGIIIAAIVIVAAFLIIRKVKKRETEVKTEEVMKWD
jgi:hypothetical protein